MQNSTRYVLSATLAVVLGGSTVFAGVTTSATASPLLSTVATVDGVPVPPAAPISVKARQYMLNILGSVLGGATPSAWKREQLANSNIYNHSAEALNAQHGYDSPGGWANTPPGTTAEYNMKRAEFEKSGRITKPDGSVSNGRGPFRPPLTRSEKFTKASNAVGGAVSVLSAAAVGWSGGVVGGKFISNALGYNVEGGLCSPGFQDFGLIGAVTGTDCEGFFAFAEEYLPNSDVVERTAGWEDTPALDGAWGGSGTSAGVGRIHFSNLNVSAAFAQGGANTASVYATISGTCKNSAWPPPDVQLVFHYKDTRPSQNGVVVGWARSALGAGAPSGYIGYPCSLTSATGTHTYTPYSHEVFDHMSVRYGAASNSVNWYPEGHALWTPGAEADPPRYLTCTIEGSDGHTYTHSSEEYRESNNELAEPECPELPEGVAPANIKIDENSEVGSNTLSEQAVTDEYLAWWQAYPECRTGGCKLDLIKLDQPTAESCFDREEACVGWFKDPNKNTNYQCRYGQHNVSMTECFVYSGVFDPNRVSVGSPYSDPMTGNWSGGQSAPKPDSQALAQTIQNPAVARSCNGMKIEGFDPVGFVMRPVQCALEWAFVARPVVLQYEATKMSTSLDKVAPGQLIAMLSSWDIDPSPMTGCSRTVPWSPANTFGTGTGETVVWNVCPGTPLEFLGTISRSVVAVGFALLVYLSLKRSTSATVDYR